jgi:hypothetical protein
MLNSVSNWVLGIQASHFIGKADLLLNASLTMPIDLPCKQYVL